MIHTLEPIERVVPSQQPKPRRRPRKPFPDVVENEEEDEDTPSTPAPEEPARKTPAPDSEETGGIDIVVMQHNRPTRQLLPNRFATTTLH